MPLSLRVFVDRSSARPDVDASLQLVVELEATGVPVEGERPPQTTVLALDVSGSMKGTPLDQVIRSVDLILDALRPIDRVGVIAFSTNATTVVEPTVLDAPGKRLVRGRVARLTATNDTNVQAGLEHAVAILGEADRQSVVLLSDGCPNAAASTPEELREVVRRHRPRVTFASLGYGLEHDEDILSAVGEAGGGGYELVADPATCARSFARALGAQGDVVAEQIEVSIAPGEGVEITRFVGREETRFGRDGVVVALPDMVPGARRLVVAETKLRAPGIARFLASLARVKVAWRTPGKRNVEDVEETIAIEIAAREPTVVADALSRAMLVRADVVREEARRAADRGGFGGAAAMLRALLGDIAAVPGFARGDGSPLAEAYELLVDEAVAMERRPTGEAYAAFRKTAVASKLGGAPPASSHGPASSRLLDLTAGEYPEAYLVVDGVRHKLGAECVIGRTAAADVAIVSDSVSRRHAEVFALEGEFWLCDLGSTNTTLLNGRAVGSKPAKLGHGDRLTIGAVDIVYEQKPR